MKITAFLFMLIMGVLPVPTLRQGTNLMSGKTFNKKILKNENQNKTDFTQWIVKNAHEIKTVDAENGFEDLQLFKFVLKDVRVVGLGEASHGTSEFFRMKHRMLEFLVNEMGFTSFYIEASMSRCRYINDYILYGKGNLDTATAIQGFVTWRVEEVRNMIEWMKQYNLSVPYEKRVKFLGFDLQINDNGWKELKQFYSKGNPDSIKNLDSLQIIVESGIRKVTQSFITQTNTGSQNLQNAYQMCLEVMSDIVLNEGQYQFIVGKEMYNKNLINIKLIVQEIKSFKDGINNQRDYYMAQNIMYLLNQEKPDAKVVVWAHNVHISKDSGKMGGYLTNILRNEYYAIGFEFYSGSFQTRNADIKNTSKDWDIMTVDDPPIESLPWYMNKTGKDKYFIDFRNTDAEKIKNFYYPYGAHSFGSMYSVKWPVVYPVSLTIFDGMIYI